MVGEGLAYMFFITVFEKIPKSGGELDIGDHWIPGYFQEYGEAVQRLHENTYDMHECIYKYAVIEKIGTGIHPNVESRQFFKYDKERNGFFEVGEPKTIKRLCNFALG